ncbi:MAG: TetR/AcrR family transcriptional regulator [Acidobacteriota bacterium]|nr:TetR/AcrR family transcriptional regulator [Acidobacteriota bacterium]
MAPTRTDRRTQLRRRREAIEQAILDATEALLADRPFRDLSIEDVMTRAGLTRTAFYRYFPDLEAVLLRQLLHARGELGRAADLWLNIDVDPREGLLPAATALAEVFCQHGRLLLALADASAGSPDIEQAWHAAIQSFVAPVQARIEGLHQQGLCQIADPAQTAIALVWMNERYLLETYGRDQGLPIPEAAQTLATIWRRTLFAEP